MWCDKANLCSDGFDRNKQNWLKNCEKRHSYISGKLENCDSAGKRDYHDYTNPTYKTDDDQHNSVDDHDREEIGQDEDHEHFKDSKNSENYSEYSMSLDFFLLFFISLCRSAPHGCCFTDHCDHPGDYHMRMVFVCVLLSSHLLRTTSDQGTVTRFFLKVRP